MTIDAVSPRRISHPVFARCYTLLSAVTEAAGASAHRDELLAGLRGEVIEVGPGNGRNFAHYPPEVTGVLAVEPEPYLRRMAARAASEAQIPVRVVEGDADRLPAADQRFDAGVASLVLCSVPDPERSLSELFRVVRPGGQLRFYEHVRAEDGRHARLQDWVDHLWPRVAGGCHTGRDTVAAIEAAGFVVERERRFFFQPSVLAKPVAPHVIGIARRP